jgi:hypothetical protein
VTSLDDVLFGAIVGGIGLCAAYFREEYIGWREHKAAEVRKQSSTRALHVDSVSHRKDADSIQSVVKLETLANTQSGGSEDSGRPPITAHSHHICHLHRS